MARGRTEIRDARSHVSAIVHRYTAALAYPDYVTLWTASLSSGAAAWALIVARGWLVYDLTGGESLWVGIVTFAAMIPRVLIPPFTGYLADRFNRRNIMASMFAVNLVHNVALAAVVLLGVIETLDAIEIEIWQLSIRSSLLFLLFLSFVNGSARAAQMPAGQALIPNLLPRNLLLNGIALNQATMNGSRLVGPLAIVPMLGLMGVEGAFILCSAFYAFSLIQALRIKTYSTGNVDTRRSFISNLLEGLKYVYRQPILRAVVIMALFHCGLTMSFESLLPVLSDTRLDAQDAGFSLLMMAVGAGAMVSIVLLAGVTSESLKGKLFLNLGVLSGLAPAVLAMSVNMPTALIAAGIMGATQAGFMTLTHTMIQSVTDDGVRGRVGAVYSVHIGGMMASANLVNGWFADVISAMMASANLFGGTAFGDMLSSSGGASFLLIVGGVGFIVVMMASWQGATIRRIYRGEMFYSHAAAD